MLTGDSCTYVMNGDYKCDCDLTYKTMHICRKQLATILLKHLRKTYVHI